MRILGALAATCVAMFPLAAVAQSMPSYDLQAICSDARKGDVCAVAQYDAYEWAKDMWDGLPSQARVNCAMSTAPNYVQLWGCIELHTHTKTP